MAECCVGSIDITHLLSSLVEKQYKFYPTMIYLISTVVNSYSEFRMAIKDEELIVWDGVNPAYTILHKETETFKDKSTDKFFCVLRLSERRDANRQLFIVTLKDDNKSDDFYIVPFAEWVVRRERVKYLVSPENQYPEFGDNISFIMKHIESVVKIFIDNYKLTTTH